MKFGRIIVHLLLGGLFIGHGTQKLFGWFGGHGLDATGQFFEGSLGLRPGKRNAIAAGVSEAGGGALLAVGVVSPVPAAAIIGTMITAVRTVHLKNGPWVTDAGWEYNAVLIAALLLLVDEEHGPLAAAGTLAAGAAASEVVLRQAKAAAPSAEAAREATPDPVGDPAAA